MLKYTQASACPFNIMNFYNWYGGGGVQLGLLRTAAANGLMYQPWVIMMMEKLVE
jgi:hypothetical protein